VYPTHATNVLQKIQTHYPYTAHTLPIQQVTSR